MGPYYPPTVSVEDDTQHYSCITLLHSSHFHSCSCRHKTYDHICWLGWVGITSLGFHCTNAMPSKCAPPPNQLSFRPLSSQGPRRLRERRDTRKLTISGASSAAGDVAATLYIYARSADVWWFIFCWILSTLSCLNKQHRIVNWESVVHPKCKTKPGDKKMWRNSKEACLKLRAWPCHFIHLVTHLYCRFRRYNHFLLLVIM